MRFKKKLKTFLAGVLTVLMIGGTINVISTNTTNAKTLDSGSDSENDRANHIVPSRGGMPTKGDVKVLVVKVGFEDYPLYSDEWGEAVYTDEEMLDMLWNLRSYYATSSYGLLNIYCDEIYEYTATGNREEYGSYSSADEEGACKLIDEVLTALDDEIDYNEYDSDSNGYIDAIYLDFAGPAGEWDSTWWPHVNKNMESEMYDGVRWNAYSFIHNSGDIEGDANVLIHETGHLLGMPDYYSYGLNQNNYIGTFDIMTVGADLYYESAQSHNGDHNGFSKWSYGWLDDEDIQYVDSSMGETVVNLTNIDSADKNGKKIAVIAPENAKENGIFSQYFLVEYDAGENLTYSVFEHLGLEPGFRIFYVNAVLNEEGNDYMKDDNYQLKDRLIYDVREIRSDNAITGYDTFYREGDEFTPDTLPDSKFYAGKIGTETGICITDFVTGENPSFKVSFKKPEDTKTSNEIHWRGETKNLGNRLELTLYSDKVIDFSDYSMMHVAYLLDSTGNKYELFVYDSEYDKYQYTFYYDSLYPMLKSNTEYTLVMPKNMFMAADGVYTDEMRIPVRTGEFMEFHLIDKTAISLEMMKTNYIQMSDNTLARIEFPDNGEADLLPVRIKEIDLDGNIVAENVTTLPIVESQKEEFLENGSFESELIRLYDDSMVLSLKYFDQTVFYKLDKTGKLLAAPQVLSGYVSGIAVDGKIKGYIVDEFGYRIENSIISIDFVSEPKIIRPDYEIIDMYAFDKDSYIIKVWMNDEQIDDIILFMDSNDEQIKSITMEYGSDVMIADDGNIRYMTIVYYSDDDCKIYSILMDIHGYIVEEKDITEAFIDSIPYANSYQLVKTDNGYLLYTIRESEYEIYKDLYVLDDEFHIISKNNLTNNVEVLEYDGVIITAFDEYDGEEEELSSIIMKGVLSYADGKKDDNKDDTKDNGSVENGDGKSNAGSENGSNNDKGNAANHNENGSSNIKNGTGDGKLIKSGDTELKKSPKTGDAGYGFAFCILLISGGIVVISKKKNVRDN